MANPSEVESQIRFALSQLPVHNAHYEFERICRYLTQQFICSNVLPATGPVSAGGDQGRDFETFRTHLRKEIGGHGAFLGLVSEGTIAFICTTQADNLLAKLRQDIKKVCTSGHPVHEILAFTQQSVPVGTRHRLQTETQELYDVRLEFHDAESITNLLARPQGFWIAERFLAIPAEIRPEPAPDDGDLSREYLERRERWRNKASPNPSFGDFIDLKTGLREAVFNPKARGDLPFWFGILRELLANPELPLQIQQRARYELVVCTLRGTGTFRTVDDLARVYLDESLSEDEPASLQDASILLSYTNTAVRMGLSSLTPAELLDWNDGLANQIEDLVPHATPDQRAILLFTLGHLGTHLALTEADIQDPGVESYVLEVVDQNGDPIDFTDLSIPESFVLIDPSRTLSAWTELTENLKETPLFPITNMADILQLFFPLWSNNVEWRNLLDMVDEAVGERSGKHVVAARVRDRAVKLIEAGRLHDALEEFHKVKIDWWSGETLRGSLLAMIFIADIYFRMRLPQASKSYALAAACISYSSADEEFADLIPAGLLMAARAEFIAGAWCSSTEFYELGLLTQHEFVGSGADLDENTAVKDAFLQLGYVNACARIIDPDLADSIFATTSRVGAEEIAEMALGLLDAKGKGYWESFGGDGLVARPFADLGDTRYIRFSALGTEWTVVAANDIDSVRKAERFAAAAQVILAALAQDDLCLVQTRIVVRIENGRRIQTADAVPIKSIPSNDGQEWVVRLTPVEPSQGVNFNEINVELMAMLQFILRETSLLPETDFSAILKKAFEKGLPNKLSPGVPYDQLAATFAAPPERGIRGSLYSAPWDCNDGPFEVCDELRWQDGPGPTYSRDTAKHLLESRYETLANGLQITVEGLASSEEFRHTVRALRKNGWLDWHILAAIANIVMNYRVHSAGLDWRSVETQEQMTQAMSSSESATAEPVPVSLFTPDTINAHRRLSMMSLLKIWGLECRQETPDVPAIERLLEARYGYWVDDVPHVDPFPDSDQSACSGGLAVITDPPLQYPPGVGE